MEKAILNVQPDNCVNELVNTENTENLVQLGTKNSINHKEYLDMGWNIIQALKQKQIVSLEGSFLES